MGGINPDDPTNIELLRLAAKSTPKTPKIDEFMRQIQKASLVRADGSPVPKHWTVFKMGELVPIKEHTFRVAYIGKTSLLFEPVDVADLDLKTHPVEGPVEGPGDAEQS